ncbi:MAG TPA: helix-turn-helix domain-containing protein [Pseudonocardia sp.]|nr:helix-turn-helix domain-containing protein [Pseudonocardia sp.]
MTDSWRADGPADDEMSDRWRAVVSDTHLPWSTHVAPGPAFAASVRRWWIDDLALVDVECAPTSGSRGRSQIAATDGEFVALLFIRAGHEVIRTNGDTVRLAPGDAVVWDSTRTARFDVPGRLSKRSLLIPRAALAEVSGGAWATPGAVLERGRPAIALLTGYLDTLAGILPGLDPAAVVAARNATLELVLGVLRPATSGGVRDLPLRAAMERFIEQHLTSMAITPERIAWEHGVSVRTVNRIFSTTGDTVGGVIRSRRLAHARDELTTGAEPISVIAHRWGFFDSSHFHRAFKASYGLSPRDYRASRR